jgi:hypothetical protein
MSDEFEALLAPGEEAKPIPGYDGDYWVTSGGKVFSMKSGNPRRLKDSPGANGYHVVVLYRDAKGTTHNVHRLVGEAFIDGCIEGKDVCHIKKDSKHDNSAENLYIGTRAENNADKIDHGTHGCKLNEELVKELRRRYYRDDVTCTELADEVSKRIGEEVSFHAIWSAVTGRSWKHLPMPQDEILEKLKKLQNHHRRNQ